MTQRRTLIGAAIAAGILYLVGAVALGSPPSASDSGATIGAWFADHHDAARTYAWTATFGTLAFAVFAAIVRGLLPAPHSSVFLLGAAAFIVENSIQAWVWGGLALDPGSLDPAAAHALYDSALFWGPVLTGSTMAMIGAVTVLGLGSEPPVPRWLTVLGAVAFAEQAIETVTVFGTGGFIAPGGDMNLILGAAVTLVWLVGVVVWAAGRLVREPLPQAAG